MGGIPILSRLANNAIISRLNAGISGLQAAQSIAIADYLPIHPAAGRVADMDLGRVVAGQRAFFGEAHGDQQPRAVTNDGDGLPTSPWTR